MNWLGKLVQKEISKHDTVLDIGCGIMQAIDGLKCKSILGIDIAMKYLDKIKNQYPTICLDVSEIHKFPLRSYDVVLALDVLEHLAKNDVYYVINQMGCIARKKVIIYTPATFKDNRESVNDSWGMGINEYQLHRCLVSVDMLKNMGFEISYPEPDKNTLAIWSA